MMEPKTLLRVRIVGEEYMLRSDASEEHTRAVADYVDRTIRAILDGGGVIETQKAAILAAIQIADELLRERAAGESLTSEIRQLAMDIRPLLPPSLRKED